MEPVGYGGQIGARFLLGRFPPVDVLSLGDTHDQHQNLRFVDLVNDPAVANGDALD